MFKKTKILILSLCLGLIPFSAPNAMKNIPKGEVYMVTADDAVIYLKYLCEERENFIKNWESIMNICLQISKEKVSKFYIDLFANFYVIARWEINLDNKNKMDLQEFVESLRKIKKLRSDIKNFSFDNEAIEKIEEIEKVAKSYSDEIEKQLKHFCDTYKESGKKLRENIAEFNRLADKCKNVIIFNDEWSKKAHYDMVYEYIENLQEDLKNYQQDWDDLLKKYKGKKKISPEDLEKFYVCYLYAMSKIFLDKNDNVNLVAFLKKMEDQNNFVFDIKKINEDCKNDLKKAFIKYRNGVKEKLKQFNKEHEEYRKELDDKINAKPREIINEAKIMQNNMNKNVISEIGKEFGSFEEFFEYARGKKIPAGTYSFSIKTDKIKEYVKNLEEYFIGFKQKWDDLLEECSKKKKITTNDLEKLSKYYHTAMSSIFLDKNDNVDVDEFLKELRENGGEYKELTQEQKSVLKDAFVKFRNRVEEKLKQFYKDHKEHEKELRSIINGESLEFDNLEDLIDYLKKIESEGDSKESNTGDIKEKNVGDEVLKNRIKEHLDQLKGYFNGFDYTWRSLLKKYKGEKKISAVDLEKFCNYYRSAMRKIFLDKNDNVDEDAFLKNLGSKNGEKYKGLSQEQKSNLKKIFVNYKKVVIERLEQFYKEHKEYKEKVDMEINKKLPVFTSIEDMRNHIIRNNLHLGGSISNNLENILENLRNNRSLEKNSEDSTIGDSYGEEIKNEVYVDRINEYLKNLQKEFVKYRNSWDNALRKYSGRKKLKDSELLEFVIIYRMFMNKIFLDENNNFEEAKFLIELAKQNGEIHERLSKEQKNILKEAFVKYKKSFDKELEKFYAQHKEYKDELLKQIRSKMTITTYPVNMMDDSMAKNNSSSKEGAVYFDIKSFMNKTIKNRINEYVDNLQKDISEFQAKWEEILEKYRSKKEIPNEVLEKLAGYYNLAISKIFLDKNNDVKVDEFLTKLEEQNNEKYRGILPKEQEDISISQEQKDILKEAFVKYKQMVNAKLEKFYKEHENYKGQLHVMMLINEGAVYFDIENLMNETFKNTINEYVDNLQKDISEFQAKWEEILEKYRSKKEIPNEVLEKLAEYYNAAISKIFLDENNNVKIDEFLTKLEEQNNEKYRGILPKGENDISISQEQKEILKEAFVECKQMVNAKLEKFYKEHENYKGQLNLMMLNK